LISLSTQEVVGVGPGLPLLNVILILQTSGRTILTTGHIAGWGDFSRGKVNVTPTGRE